MNKNVFENALHLFLGWFRCGNGNECLFSAHCVFKEEDGFL